jgi:peptidoglycan DL-endopeptidase LytF
MSRRDTIIIAVLINAGLLIVLFATALKSNNAAQDLASEQTPAFPNFSELPVRQELTKLSGDEVDQVLSQYSHAAPSQSQPSIAAASMEPNVPAAPAELISDVKEIPVSQPNFAEDLQAISAPAPAPSASNTSNAFSLAAAGKDGNFAEIRVKKGDVLEKIARAHSTTVEEIMRLNQLSSTKLKIGQSLRIPPKGGKKVQPSSVNVAKAAPAPSKASSAPKFYVVKNGDNPWTIAVKNHMKVDELLKLNHLDEEKARHLKPGDQLRIK